MAVSGVVHETTQDQGRSIGNNQPADGKTQADDVATNTPLEDIISDAVEDTDGDEVSLRDVLELYGNRSFGAIFTILGLLCVIPPVGAIPGLPAAVGVVIILFSVQMLIGRSHIWLPGPLGSLSISKDKLKKAEDRASPVLSFIDGMITDRLEWATGGVARYVGAILVTLMAIALIPLELVPFAVAAPGAAITLVGVALLARDGALMILAYLISAAAIWVLIQYSPLLKWLGL